MIKLMDFYLAKNLNQALNEEEKKSQQIIGTPLFQCPEIMKSNDLENEQRHVWRIPRVSRVTRYGI